MNQNEKSLTVQQKATSLRDYLQSAKIKSQLEMALPKWLSADRLLRVTLSSVLKTPKILECTTESILQSVMQCAVVGLEPILGRAYLIPYNNNKQVGGKWVKVMECQMQVGYQGLIDLARRSGQVRDVYAQVVYENDHFEIEYGTERRILHNPTLEGDPGQPIGVYTVWELESGVKTFEYMPIHEVYKRRERSQAWRRAQQYPDDKNAQETPWIQWPEEMIKKTVMKHFAKVQPASIEIMQAVELDDAAEMGRSLTMPFMGQLEMPKEGEEEPTQESLVEQFDNEPLILQYMGGPDEQSLGEYIQQCADHFNQGDIDAFKAQVMREGNFEDFWKAYHKQKEPQTTAGMDSTGPDSNQESDTEELDPDLKKKIEKLRKIPQFSQADVINLKTIAGFWWLKEDGWLAWEKENRSEVKNMAPAVKNGIASKHRAVTGEEYVKWLEKQETIQAHTGAIQPAGESTEEMIDCPKSELTQPVAECSGCEDIERCDTYAGWEFSQRGEG